MTPEHLWLFLPLGYLFSILLEGPILFVGLGRAYSWRARLFAGGWLTACTYPIVVLVLPLCLDAVGNRHTYLAVAETFAPVAECLLFAAALGNRATRWRDSLVIILANLVSFGAGELVFATGGF
jgi:hypothetical protein